MISEKKDILIIDTISPTQFEIIGDLTFDSIDGALEIGKKLFSLKENITINLSKVKKVDSAGLSLLLEWISFFNQSDKEITYEKIPEQITNIAKISGVISILDGSYNSGSKKSSSE
tara:strand:+ start:1378 stop:1725 length:348 start_codon:yes stop_codon:yes gene_type:complete